MGRRRNIHSFVILAHKESDDLEECIKSVMKQSVKSNVIIATSTKNNYIIDLASKYGLGVMVNENVSNKGGDYNFAINSFNTRLITIAHQDDLYDRNYTKEILKCYQKNKDASIIFTDNYEIKKDVKIKHSKQLFLKRLLRNPLRYSLFQNRKYFKLLSVKYLNCICTSSVTFIKKNISNSLFPTDLIYYNDWDAFINLAKEKSKFVYLRKKLVGYRIIDKKENNSEKTEKRKIYEKLWTKKVVDYIYKRKK